MNITATGASHFTPAVTQIATCEPLPIVLETIVAGIEAALRGALGSVLLLDEGGEQLLLGAAPSLPDFYNDAIHGVRIGPSVGSCGTAAYTGEMVIVEDIQTDPLWNNFKHLAAEAGLASCWSAPIVAANSRVLGTFAMYRRQISAPSADDVGIVTLAAHLAAIAIERKRSEEALATLRLTQVVVDPTLENIRRQSSEAQWRLTDGVSPYYVRRAMVFMQENPALPISMAQVAAKIGVSIRTLQTGFQAFKGMSPMSYLREIRLVGAHRELQGPLSIHSIAEIALRWGFPHPGRFSAAYQRRFGELPSRTLSQHRRR